MQHNFTAFPPKNKIKKDIKDQEQCLLFFLTICDGIAARKPPLTCKQSCNIHIPTNEEVVKNNN
jgi:hypothetical protein